ncbi:hypothetical protein HBI64_166580 [Parastagonospora nodorum]|nr:hypothetical protein HBI64_166580 [Parastagonospora nodorum]
MNINGSTLAWRTARYTGARQRSTTFRKEEIENYAKRNSTVFITRDYTTIKLIRLSNFYMKNALRSVQSFLLLSHPVILLSQLLTNDRTTLCSTPSEARKTALLLVRSSIATTLCRKVTAVYALNYLELRVLKLTLMGTVLYNAIKEYHDDGTRKTIHFYSYTVEDDYHDNDVDDILIKYIDDKRQRYNTLIEDYNRAGKREDNILTVDECRTGHSNEEDIEADEREEETRVRLRELSEEIHDILLREFRGADDFTESVTHNDDEQDEFAMLAEEYMIDNRIVHALALTKDEWELELEDCDALVERYEEEINCSNLYSTV